jgi:hypothetical protein
LPDPSKARRRSGNPAVRAGAGERPRPSGSGREHLERRSAGLLARLGTLPRWLVVGAVVAITVAGLLVPGVVGGVLLAVVAGLLGWLVALTWPVVGLAGRVIRVLLVAVVLAVAVAKVAGLR